MIPAVTPQRAQYEAWKQKVRDHLQKPPKGHDRTKCDFCAENLVYIKLRR